jgi:hypothetical protein
VCRFIEQGCEQWLPDDLLHLFLPKETTDNSLHRNTTDTIITDKSPTKGLDKIYSQILEHSFKGVTNGKDRQQLASIFRQVVGVIVILFNPLSVVSISRLLHVNDRKVRLRLRHLHSVLEVPNSPS